MSEWVSEIDGINGICVCILYECARSHKKHLNRGKKGKVHTDLILCRIFCRFFGLRFFHLSTLNFPLLISCVVCSSPSHGIHTQRQHLRRAEGETFRMWKKHLCICVYSVHTFQRAKKKKKRSEPSRCSLLLPLRYSITAVAGENRRRKESECYALWLKFVKRNRKALFSLKSVCVVLCTHSLTLILTHTLTDTQRWVVSIVRVCV